MKGPAFLSLTLLVVTISYLACNTQKQSMDNRDSTKAASPGQPVKNTSFKPGTLWYDDKGEIINAHGGGVLHANNTYYWCGKSTDPEFESKMLNIVGLYLNPQENAIVLCID